MLQGGPIWLPFLAKRADAFLEITAMEDLLAHTAGNQPRHFPILATDLLDEIQAAADSAGAAFCHLLRQFPDAGGEIVDDLRRVSPGIRVILSTGYAKGDEVERKVAWDATLAKPYVIEAMEDALAIALAP